MEFDVEVAVVDPVRIVEVERHLDQLLAEGAGERNAAAVEVQDRVEGDGLARLGRIEQEDHAYVLGVLRGLFGEDEHRIGHLKLSHDFFSPPPPLLDLQELFASS